MRPRTVTDATANVLESQRAAAMHRRREARGAQTLAKRLGLRLVAADALTIRRRRCGKGWTYLDPDNRVIRERATVQRLARLAVPPAYADVLYAAGSAPRISRRSGAMPPAGCNTAIIRTGRRCARSARRGASRGLADVLPRIRRSVAQHLSGDAPTREFASAAVIELVARSAIRPGTESYARLRGTRGAATLLKSNVTIYGESITLTFRSKGGKTTVKEVSAPRLAAAITLLRELPGRRLFQYRAASGDVRHVTAHEVNAFLREIAGVHISLKDFRTLLASASVLETLAHIEPAASERQRRKQVLAAVRVAADDLHNTPAICRKSYVNGTVVAAFEEGVLERFSQTLKDCRSPLRRAQVLAKIIAAAAA